MVDKDKEKRDGERERTDARKFAELLKSTHREELLNNFVGVALSSYMNGVYDACQSFKAVQPPV